MNYLMRLSISLLIVILFILSCKHDENNDNHNINHDTVKIPDKENPILIDINEKKEGAYVFGDQIEIKFSVKDKTQTDSLIISINNVEQNVISLNDPVYIFDTKTAKVGKNTIEVELNREGVRFRKNKSILILSDTKPENYSYKVINVYKHDVKAYTQGLFFDNGFFYEATGLKGESTVRKVKPETGEVIQSFAISKEVFGEGIVRYKDKIIQLSWESGRGFVYDYSTFKLIDEFNYAGEGWGICTDNTYLYMSNGTHQIKVLEADSYSEIKTLEVYDHEKAVKYLNEMEYINGYIYANIYQYEQIVKIDPLTGKVLAYIDLSGILPMNDYTNKTDVLNGIAYDSEKDRIFVTGKNWPKLFEIKLVKNE